MYNSFIFNNWIMLLKVLRLTFLAICVLFYFFSISCSNSQKNQSINVSNYPNKAENAVNLNTATEKELEKLPKIGNGIAKRIIEFREKYGNFRRSEHLILVRGISDKKYREIQNLIKVE